MKTRQFITAMLIALIFGTVTIQAQSARRTVPHEKNERTTTTRTNTRKATPQKAQNVQATRQVQKQQVQHQKVTPPARNVQATRQVQTQQVQRQTVTPPARNVQANRQVQTQQVQRQTVTPPARNVQATRQVQTQQVQRQTVTPPARNVQANRQVQTQQVQRHNTTQQVRKPVSMSTPKNPRSTYKKPNTEVYANHNQTGHNRNNQYTTERYYSGNHYHYVYPTRKVKFHYHHDTYVHNYHVLYYPTYTNIYWTRNMYRDYRRWYPEYHWRYNYGYRINTISAFDAKYNLGEVANVYGRVYSSWYNNETDDYLLFFGGEYPYQQFTVVLPGHIARRFSWRPERYFLGEHITVTGLITTFDGNPEIIVKHKRQLGLY